jgi:hypothetical protein
MVPAIHNFHTTNHYALSLLSVLSLFVSWQWISTMEILQLLCSRRCPLDNTPQLNCQLSYSTISSQPPLQNSDDSLSESKSKLCYDRQSAGQSVLEQSTPLGLMTRSWLLSDSCGFVDLGRPLWREDGSAGCNYYWPSPAQAFSGPSLIRLVAIFYCLRF